MTEEMGSDGAVVYSQTQTRFSRWTSEKEGHDPLVSAPFSTRSEVFCERSGSVLRSLFPDTRRWVGVSRSRVSSQGPLLPRAHTSPRGLVYREPTPVEGDEGPFEENDVVGRRRFKTFPVTTERNRGP